MIPGYGLLTALPGSPALCLHLYKMPGRAIPAADLTATTLTELWRSELLVSYSSFFWNMQKRVGQEDLPVDLTRAEADESHDTMTALLGITSRLSLH